jgi:hypothetical protein
MRGARNFMETRMTTENTITIKFNNEDRDIFMSFGLLNDLTKLVSDPSEVPRILLDPDLRDAVLKELLAERKRSGKILKELPDVEDIDASPEDIEKLLDWTMEHVISFFVRSLKKTAQMGERHLETLKSLQSSLDGSNGSASKIA